jgi:cytochrome P450
MVSYAEESIHRYKTTMEAEPQNPKPTLFTKLVKAVGESMPEAEMISNAQAYITAGSETTFSYYDLSHMVRLSK